MKSQIQKKSLPLFAAILLLLLSFLLPSCGQASAPGTSDDSLGASADPSADSRMTSADSRRCESAEDHRFTVITSVTSEGVKAKCAVCGEETVLREKQDFADFDRDESHFTYTVDEDGNAVITSYNCSAAKVYFPATIGGHKVVSIDLDETMEWPATESGFDIGGHITEVAIAPGIARIEARAFLKWVSLSEVYLMEGLRSIGDAALARTSLQQVYLPDGLQSLGSSVFGRSNLLFLSIPASVEKIDEPETLVERNEDETEFFVSEDNPNYSSVNGSLCSGDQKTVYQAWKGE